MLKKLALGLALAASLTASAQLTATQAFVDAPQSIFPLLDRDLKLDMVDYFNSGMTTASTNRLNGKSRITAMDADKLEITMSDASTYQLAVVPTAAGDTAIVLIATVATPAPDSKMSVYSSDWSSNLTSRCFTKPVLADWLTPQAKAGEVEGLVPFLLISYSYDPATRSLTLTNNTAGFLSEDVYEIVKPELRTNLTYTWDGKSFKRKEAK